MLNQTTTIIVTIGLCALGIAIAEVSRDKWQDDPAASALVEPTRLSARIIRAPGRITGATEEIEIRSMVIETVDQIHVKEGQRVKRGDLLITLQNEILQQECRLAQSTLEERVAALDRIRNGSRETERQVVRHEWAAAQSKLEAIKARSVRAEQLALGNAISGENLEQIRFSFRTQQALAEAATSRKAAIEEPARTEDVASAMAAVRAAKAKLAMANERLRQTLITAPIDSTILKVNTRLGELPGMSGSEPLIVLCNLDQWRAMVDVDEFDALQVGLGQSCEVTADSVDGILAKGIVTHVEPQMQRKELFGQWADERNDSFSRRVWVDLTHRAMELPVGLPIRVQIDTTQTK